MVREAIQLFGSLVVAFLGVVAPFLLIILSMSSEGTKELILQYEIEKKQNEENIKKLATGSINVDDIEKNIKSLKSNNKNVQNKLSSLDIRKQTLRLFIPLIISFSLIILTLIFYYNLALLIIFISLAVIIFCYSLIMAWKALCNIAEVRKLIDDKKRDYKNKNIEILTELKDIKKPENIYLKDGYYTLNNKKLELEKTNIFNLSLREKNNLNIKFYNNEKIMIKNLELGLFLPSEFLIDNKSEFKNYYSVLESNQLIRFFYPLLQGESTIEWNELIVIPITLGNFKPKLYIKAENFKSTYINVDFNVMESNYENMKFKLKSATWGTNEKYFDVYKILLSRVNKDGLMGIASNDIFGDPYKGKRKKLIINYISYGKEQKVEIPEDESRQLP